MLTFLSVFLHDPKLIFKKKKKMKKQFPTMPNLQYFPKSMLLDSDKPDGSIEKMVNPRAGPVQVEESNSSTISPVLTRSTCLGHAWTVQLVIRSGSFKIITVKMGGPVFQRAWAMISKPACLRSWPNGPTCRPSFFFF